MLLKKRPYHLLAFTGLILVLISFFLNQKQTLDIHVHDTYFIIGMAQVFWLFSILILFIWALYLLTGKVLYSKRLTWMHVVLTLMALVLILLLVYAQNKNINPLSSTSIDFSRLRAEEQHMRFIGYSAILFILVQIVFLLNLFAGLFKRRA